jgi:hypothetical protein
VKSIYIAGPMSGLPEFNFPAFFAAAAAWEASGVTVYNPANKDSENDFDPETYAAGDAAKSIKEGFDFREAYLWDIDCVIKADGIYMLRGWQNSPGAAGEHAVAVAVRRHYPDYQIIYEN